MTVNFEVEITQDLRYGDDERQVFDLYLPRTATPPPVVVYFHGGGWVTGDKSAGAAKRLETLAKHGIAVVAANYRLAPEWTFPTQVRDGKAVIAWIRQHGEELGVDVRRLGVWGASAGGYIASMLALTSGDPLLAEPTDLEHDQVDAAVIWFSPADLSASTAQSWLEKIVLPPPSEFALLGADRPFEDQVEAASPLHRAHRASAPFLIVHGDRDRMVPIQESASLHDALTRAGAQSTFITLGGAGHESPHFDSPEHIAMTAGFLIATLSSSPLSSE